MALAVDTIFGTPEYHFLSFDGDDALFVRMDRLSYHRSIFLDGRISSPEPQPIRTPLAPLIVEARGREIPRTGWIFHVAHCGSTLLARMIDQPQSGLVLREPPPLRQLGIQSAGGRQSRDWADRLRLAVAMASRRFEPSQRTVVKANVPVNFILPQILELDPGAPVILLYFALEPYLLAILRDADKRAWVDRLTRQLGPALAAATGLRPEAPTAERAAALWLAQMLVFNTILNSIPSARSLDAEVFFASPAEVAEAAALHFNMSATEGGDELDRLTSTYSKDPSRPFDEAARRRRQEDDRGRLEQDLAKARRWIDSSPTSNGLPASLDRPLFGAASPLLG